MHLLFALLADSVVPQQYQGPAWVLALTGALYTFQRLGNQFADWLSARKIQEDEKRLKAEAQAAQQQPTAVPFIPESLEARVFRLEKERMERDLKDALEDAARYREDNLLLHERITHLQDDLLLKERQLAEQRAEIRRLRETRAEDTRSTTPVKKDRT